MKTTYQHAIDLVQKTKAQYSYDGSDLATWQKQARERLLAQVAANIKDTLLK